MHESLDLYPEDKEEFYQLLNAQLKSLLENETCMIPNLGNASALLGLALKDINWAGFYLIHKQELLLGPFQGKPACIHIPVGKGVCGVAAATKETQVVADVHEFPGHIACDSASRSEIVIPMCRNGQLIGVLDIDSPKLARFDLTDRKGLEEFAAILVQGTEWKDVLS